MYVTVDGAWDGIAARATGVYREMLRAVIAAGGSGTIIDAGGGIMPGNTVSYDKARRIIEVTPARLRLAQARMRGMTAKGIARKLGVSSRTVDNWSRGREIGRVAESLILAVL